MKSSLLLAATLLTVNAFAASADNAGFQKLADCKPITPGTVLFLGDASDIKGTSLRPDSAELSQGLKNGELTLQAVFKGKDVNMSSKQVTLEVPLSVSNGGQYYSFYIGKTASFPALQFARLEIEFLLENQDADPSTAKTALFSVLASDKQPNPRTGKGSVTLYRTSHFMCDVVKSN